LQFFLGVSATLIIGGMWFACLPQLAVAACWNGSRVSLLWALLVQVATSTPQTMRRLPTVGPDVTELLAVMTLSKASLGPIRLHLYGNVAKAGQMEDFLDFPVLGKVMRYRGRFLVVAVSLKDDQCVIIICLMLRTSKPRFTSPSQIFSAEVLGRRWHITAFMGFWDFGKKEK
jgi:hypothetical protein